MRTACGGRLRESDQLDDFESIVPADLEAGGEHAHAPIELFQCELLFRCALQCLIAFGTLLGVGWCR